MNELNQAQLEEVNGGYNVHLVMFVAGVVAGYVYHSL